MNWGVVVPLLVLLAAPAQSLDHDENQVICTLAVRIPGGTAEDLENIREQPVPPSMAAAFADAPCNAVPQNSLLDWHLRVGDEATTTAALDYIEQRRGANTPDPAAYAAELERAFAKATPDLRKFVKLRAANKYPEAERLRSHSKSIKRLNALAETYNGHGFVARSFVQAARFWHSPALLARARPHLDLVLTARKVLDAVPTEPEFDPRQHTLFYDDMVNFPALLNQQAETLQYDFDGASRPGSELLASYDEDARDELMNLAEDGLNLRAERAESESTESLFKVMDDYPNFPHDVSELWALEVQADLADARRAPVTLRSCDPREWDRAHAVLAILASQEDMPWAPNGYGRPVVREPFKDQRIALYLDKVRCHGTIADGAAAAGDENIAHYQFALIFETLDMARQLVQPDENPARFRQIATAFADTLARCRAYAATTPDYSPLCTISYSRPLATYFETNLAALDAIASGATASE